MSQELKEELKACLQLQQEIEAKLATRYKAILETAGNQRVIVELDGNFYELKTDDQSEMRLGRKLKGFYAQYRLISLGKPI